MFFKEETTLGTRVPGGSCGTKIRRKSNEKI